MFGALDHLRGAQALAVCLALLARAAFAQEATPATETAGPQPTAMATATMVALQDGTAAGGSETTSPTAPTPAEPPAPPDASSPAAPEPTATSEPEPAAAEPDDDESPATPTRAAAEASATATVTAPAATSTATPTSTRIRPSRTPSSTPTRTASAPPGAASSRRPSEEARRPSAAPRGVFADPMIRFAAGALAVLIGLLSGAALSALPRRRRERRARAAAATAILAELRWIDAVLRKIAERGSASPELSLEHPIIEAGLSGLSLFDPETAGRIADLHYHLRGLAAEIHRYRENPKAWVGRVPELDRLLRHKAVVACRAVPELSKALRRAGGTLAAPVAGAEPHGDEGLPPTPFSEGDGDEWTL